MASLKLKHIYKVYDSGVKAVNDFTIDIEDKEFIVFVGPSGCGKSTTLRMIAGLEDISAGELEIDGKIVNELEPKDRDIAMVFQNYALYPHMTVYENMAFGLKLKKVPAKEIHDKVMWAAGILGLKEYLDRKPKAMSGGQRQRVALGRAMLREPKVFLLDEPLSNLDAKLRTQMRAEISKLHSNLNTTFIYVTHDQVEAMTMGTRIVVMKDGFVQQIENPKDLYLYPANKFVAGFIGSPQMNFFEATLAKVENGIKLHFSYSNSEVVVPFEYLMKLKPLYMDGKTVVSVGLRAENISLEADDVAKSKTIMDVRISHLEELGTETLVYADLHMEGDGYTESSTRVIIKAKGMSNFTKGQIVKAAFDFKYIHLFDKETEESLLPRVPKAITINASIKNNNLFIDSIKIDIPNWLRLENGDKYQVTIPISSIKISDLGKYDAIITECEKIEDFYLLYLNIGNKLLFSRSNIEFDKNQKIKFDIDFKQLNIYDENQEIVHHKIDVINRFQASLLKVKEKDKSNNKKLRLIKSIKYKFNILGSDYDVPDNILNKIFNAYNINSLDKKFIIEASNEAIMIKDNGKIKLVVKDIIEYGQEKYAKVSIFDEDFIIKSNNLIKGQEILVDIDLENCGVVEKEQKVRIC